MTEIHVLPTARLGPDQLVRVRSELVEKYVAGVDLGSRVPHIHATGDTLLKMSGQLQDMVDAFLMVRSPHGDETVSSAAEGALLHFVDLVKGLAAFAHRFPSGEATPDQGRDRDLGLLTEDRRLG